MIKRWVSAFAVGLVVASASILAVSSRAEQAVVDLQAWVGKWPFQIVETPEFRMLAGHSVTAKVAPYLETAPQAESVGGRWIIMEGCREHSCGIAEAFVVVDAVSGTVFAWVTNDGVAGIRQFGSGSPVSIPGEVAERRALWQHKLRAKAPR